MTSTHLPKPTIFALAAIVTIIAGGFGGLVFVAATGISDTDLVFDSFFFSIVRFTLLQAVLSTVLSLVLAVPVARAFSRQNSFWGRRLLLWLFALPLSLPALVVVLAVLGVWGKQGWVQLPFGISIFGLSGILIAHVFFNMPLATRLILSRFDSIPAENWRLANQLDLPASAIFRIIEWPVLKSALPSAGALIFMLCLTSFTIVLTLGGGPKATTIEVAIYQALRFDFDMTRAVFLALTQLGLTIILLLVAHQFSSIAPQIPALSNRNWRLDGQQMQARITDFLIIIAASIFIIAPMISLSLAGIKADLLHILLDPAVHSAIITSLIIAALAALVSLIICWALLIHSAGKSVYISMSASIILVVPPIVLGSGWFVILHRFGDVFSMAPFIVIIINALMALPFVYRVLGPAMHHSARQHDRLSASLGITGMARWKIVDWPVLKKPFAIALAFAMALSLGDLGVIALFGSEHVRTLPLLLLQKMGAYRSHEAAGLALLLAAMCLVLIFTSEKLVGENRQ